MRLSFYKRPSCQKKSTKIPLTSIDGFAFKCFVNVMGY